MCIHTYSCMAVCINIYTYISSCVCQYIQTRVCRQIYMSMHACTCKSIHICVTVCTRNHHFPLQNEGQLEHSLKCSTQSNYLCSGDQVHAQTFPPKVDMTSLEHHLMMYWWCGIFGWWHLHHSYISVEGYKRTNARGEWFPVLWL